MQGHSVKYYLKVFGSETSPIVEAAKMTGKMEDFVRLTRDSLYDYMLEVHRNDHSIAPHRVVDCRLYKIGGSAASEIVGRAKAEYGVPTPEENAKEFFDWVVERIGLLVLVEDGVSD